MPFIVANTKSITFERHYGLKFWNRLLHNGLSSPNRWQTKIVNQALGIYKIGTKTPRLQETETVLPEVKFSSTRIWLIWLGNVHLRQCIDILSYIILIFYLPRIQKLKMKNMERFWNGNTQRIDLWNIHWKALNLMQNIERGHRTWTNEYSRKGSSS